MEIFIFFDNERCVYSLELPQWVDTNEYTQHTIIL